MSSNRTHLTSGVMYIDISAVNVAFTVATLVETAAMVVCSVLMLVDRVVVLTLVELIVEIWLVRLEMSTARTLAT